MQEPTPSARRKNGIRRQPLILIGFAVILLGVTGLSIELLKPSEEEVFEELIVEYDEEEGFAPFFAPSSGTPTPSALPAQGTIDPQQAEATPTPDPNRASAVLGLVPDRLQVPSIRLDAPVVPVNSVDAELEGVSFTLWLAPRGFRVGWHASSSLLGLGGNTVFNGHHNAFDKVFEHLIDVEEGDRVIVSSGDHVFEYVVTTKLIFPERFETFETRMENTVWIGPTDDERITMVTCWPATSNTHRLVVVAKPDPTSLEGPLSATE